MKFSESWLRTFVNPDLSSEALSHMLTMAGLEVEELDPVAPFFSDVLIAEVLEVVKHPDADRLNVCQVNVGAESPVTIVCGAPNVAPGLKVPCALPGAVLPGDFKIKVAKVRGIQSSGMLCSAKELGIAEESSGLLVLSENAPVGQSIRTYLDLDDHLFTLKLTPNRADCLSLKGIAREVGAITGTPVLLSHTQEIEPVNNLVRTIHLGAAEACPLYFGRLISGVNAAAPTPCWMVQRLERSGIRSISALVDITNYVLLETGQPLHAFDNACLEHEISVRFAEAGEKLRLLNEQEIALDADMLIIADQKGPLALAGIMGGAASGVTTATTEVFLESAFFAPKAIAGRARRLSFSSDASHRFERGVDFGGCRAAIERATALILEICGGQCGPVVEASNQFLPARLPVKLRLDRANRVLGVDFTVEQIAALFTGLGLSYQLDSQEFLVTPPTWRFDLQIEEDLIEEVARLYGYDNIPAVAPKANISMMPVTEMTKPVRRLRHLLAGRGYQEVINFAFVEEAWEKDFAGNENAIRLANPIASHLSVMRTTLFGGLIANLQTNLKRKQTRIRLFELGRVFDRSSAGELVEGFSQPWHLAGLIYGSADAESWGADSRKVDFYDAKGDLQGLLASFEVNFVRVNHPALHPGRAAQILLNGEAIGVVGELHPEWVQKYDLPSPPVVFELSVLPLLAAKLPEFQEVSRYPAVTRDLALIVDQGLMFDGLIKSLWHVAEPIVKAIDLFDVYTGKGVPEDKKSLAFRIVMQDTQRTLQDSEVDSAVQKIIACAEESFGAQLRA